MIALAFLLIGVALGARYRVTFSMGEYSSAVTSGYVIAYFGSGTDDANIEACRIYGDFTRKPTSGSCYFSTDASVDSIALQLSTSDCLQMASVEVYSYNEDRVISTFSRVSGNGGSWRSGINICTGYANRQNLLTPLGSPASGTNEYRLEMEVGTYSTCKSTDDAVPVTYVDPAGASKAACTLSSGDAGQFNVGQIYSCQFKLAGGDPQSISFDGSSISDPLGIKAIRLYDVTSGRRVFEYFQSKLANMKHEVAYLYLDKTYSSQATFSFS